MIVVALYCGARFLRPALRVAGHGRDLEIWHLLMVGTMAAMLVASPPLDQGGVGLALFAVGLGWSLFQLARRHLSTACLASPWPVRR